MKLAQNNYKIDGTIESTKSRAFSIDPNNVNKIMNVLTALYPKPVEAVVREYITNAYDSHKEAGQKKPINIKTPTDLKPELIIRDFGIGLEEDETLDIYGLYGYSTKDSDNEYTGALGFGSKSALCLVSDFTVTVYKNGRMAEINIHRQQDGSIVSVVLDSRESDEPTGVEVKIPIKSRDIQECEKELVKFLMFQDPSSYNLYGSRFDPSSFMEPIDITDKIRNEQAYKDKVKSYEIKKAGAISDSESERYNRGLVFGTNIDSSNHYGLRGHVFLRMGAVSYPVDAQTIGTIFNELKHVNLFQKSKSLHILEAPLGDVDIAPNREELAYTPRTKDWLKNHIASIVELQLEEVKEAVREADEPYRLFNILNTLVPGAARDINQSMYGAYKKLLKRDGEDLQTVFTPSEDVATYSQHWNSETQHFYPSIAIPGSIGHYCYDGQVNIVEKNNVTAVVYNADDILKEFSTTNRKKFREYLEQNDMDPTYFVFLGKNRTEDITLFKPDMRIDFKDIEKISLAKAKKVRPAQELFKIFYRDVSKEDKEKKVTYKFIPNHSDNTKKLNSRFKRATKIIISIPTKDRNFESTRIRIHETNILLLLNHFYRDKDFFLIVSGRTNWKRCQQEFSDAITIDDFFDTSLSKEYHKARERNHYLNSIQVGFRNNYESGTYRFIKKIETIFKCIDTTADKFSKSFGDEDLELLVSDMLKLSDNKDTMSKEINSLSNYNQLIDTMIQRDVIKPSKAPEDPGLKAASEKNKAMLENTVETIKSVANRYPMLRMMSSEIEGYNNWYVRQDNISEETKEQANKDHKDIVEYIKTVQEINK